MSGGNITNQRFGTRRELLFILVVALGGVVTALSESIHDFGGTTWLLLIITTAAVLLLTAFRPRVAVLSLAVSTPLTPEFPIPVAGVEGAMLNIDLILIPVVVLRFLTTAGIRDNRVSLSDIDASLLLFAGVAVLSLIVEIGSFSTEILISFLYLAEWVVYCSIPFLIQKYIRSRDDARVFFILLLIGASAIMFHLLARHFIIGVPRLPGGRGTFHNPLGPGTVNRLRTFWSQNSNAVGAFLSIHATVVAGVAPKLTKRLKISGYVFVFICIYLIFWTFSRSSMLAAGVGLGLVVITYRPLSALLASIVGGVVAVLFVPKRFFFRILSTFRPSQYVPLPIGGLDSRLFGWRRQFRLFLEEPILGTGFHLIPETLVQTGYGGFWSPDNGHLQVLIGTGIVGYLLYLSVFAISLRYAINVARSSNIPMFRGIGIGVAAALMGFLSGSMFYDIFVRWRVLGPLFCYIGLIISIYHIESGSSTEP